MRYDISWIQYEWLGAITFDYKTLVLHVESIKKTRIKMIIFRSIEITLGNVPVDCTRVGFFRFFGTHMCGSRLVPEEDNDRKSCVTHVTRLLRCNAG